MHEIITIQLGHRANYLATHFWNTQESYFTYDTSQAPSPINHDVHFRPGLGLRGEETFTPRTLIYDLKGAFGSMRKGAGLYDGVDEARAQGGQDGAWNGNIINQEEAPIPISDYQRGLDQGLTSLPKLTTSSVKYWSDFNRVFYHPRSIVQINDFVLASSLMPFDKWASGEELFEEMDRAVDLLDRDLRVWAEECDHMQGIQMIGSCDDAWGGFGARYVDKIRDEFGKTALWVWAIEGGSETGSKVQQSLSVVNTARSIHDISSQATMYIPLHVPSSKLPPYVNIDRSSQWHISALLSMAMETMTLPSRLRLSHELKTLDALASSLNVSGNQRIASLHCSVSHQSAPEPSNLVGRENDDRLPGSAMCGGELGEDSNASGDASQDIDFSGAVAKISRNHTFGRVESLRGYSRLPDLADREDVLAGMRKRRRLGSRMIEKYHTPLEFPLLDSFPNIVSPASSSSSSLAIHSSLSTTTSISSRIKTLQKLACRMVSVDERESLSNGLRDISEEYEEGWNSGSDDDSDD